MRIRYVYHLSANGRHWHITDLRHDVVLPESYRMPYEAEIRCRELNRSVN